MPDSSDIVHCVCVFCLLKKSLICSLKLRGLCLCADEDEDGVGRMTMHIVGFYL